MFDAHAHAFADSGLGGLAVGHSEPSYSPHHRELLRSVLEEMDNAVVLIDARRRILHTNRLAQRELASGTALCAIQGVLQVAHSAQLARLAQATRSAEVGCRVMIDLGAADHPLAVAFVPLDRSSKAYGEATIMVVCGKHHLSENRALQFYARSQKLSSAEESVLQALCMGMGPDEIAQQHGVRLSTVRTQITHIRTKTGATSVRALVARVSALPPMGPSLMAHGLQ
jgi:DNA-binding CsgD family transcriptional regulator